MNFFQTLDQSFPDADLNIRIKAKSGSMSVSVLPVSKTENDIEPIILTGTPEDLDAQFFELVSAPVEETKAALVNLEEHKKSIEEAKEEKKPEPKQEKKSDKKTDSKKPTVKKKEVTPPPIIEGDLFGSNEDDPEQKPDTNETTEADQNETSDSE